MKGFLPKEDPLQRLSKEYAIWEEVARDLPKLLAQGKLRTTLGKLPVLNVASLKSAELERGMLLLSYFGHGYVWERWTTQPPDRLPKSVAVPWAQIAKKLGRPPVLSYASYALHNWRRLNPKGPVELGNIALLQNFLGGLDEEWFILVHVDIEAKAEKALTAIPRAVESATENNPSRLAGHLSQVAEALEKMNQTLLRMPEGCDPYIYYNRVRPYIHGWKDNPALPEGLYYEGVEEFEGKPQKFRGETGAQSTIIPTLDAALGVTHGNDRLKIYLMEMREYMPRDHRQFLERVEQTSTIRGVVLGHKKDNKVLTEIYNRCVELVEKFRSTHLEYAKSYVANQAQKSIANPTQVGTGGTPFVSYLAKHRDETEKHKVR